MPLQRAMGGFEVTPPLMLLQQPKSAYYKAKPRPEAIRSRPTAFSLSGYACY